MTDTTNPAPAKAMWTRCAGCQDRIYNNPHDVKIHRLHCPHDLQMRLQKLTERLDKLDNAKDAESLTSRVHSLEQTVGDLDEHISAEPALDPDGIDPWPGETTDTDDFDDDDTVAGATVTGYIDPLDAPTGRIDASGLYAPGGGYGTTFGTLA